MMDENKRVGEDCFACSFPRLVLSLLLLPRRESEALCMDFVCVLYKKKKRRGAVSRCDEKSKDDDVDDVRESEKKRSFFSIFSFSFPFFFFISFFFISFFFVML